MYRLLAKVRTLTLVFTYAQTAYPPHITYADASHNLPTLLMTVAFRGT